jgi:hypothetical protein
MKPIYKIANVMPSLRPQGSRLQFPAEQEDVGRKKHSALFFVTGWMVLAIESVLN